MSLLNNRICIILNIILFFLLAFLVMLNFVSIPSNYSNPYLSKQSINVCFDVKSDKNRLVEFEIFPLTVLEKNFNNRVSYSKSLTADYLTVCQQVPLNSKLKEIRFDFGIDKAFYTIKNLIIGDKLFSIEPSYIDLSSDFKIINSSQSEIFFESIGEDPYFVLKHDFSDDNLTYKIHNESYIINNLYYYTALLQTKLSSLTFSLLSFFCLITLFNFRNSFIVRSTIIFYTIFLIYYVLLHKDAVSVYREDYLNAYYRIFISTLPISITIVALAFLSSILKRMYLKIIPTVLGCVLIAFVLADVFTFKQFNVHITISDILKFKSDAIDSFDIIKDFISENKRIVFIFAFLFIFYVNTTIRMFDIKFKTGSFILSCFIIPLFLPQPQKTLWDNMFLNIFQNGQTSYNAKVQYSQGYNYLSYTPNLLTHNGLNLRKNVIVLFVESLSAKESLLYGGENNNLPFLDNIARRNIYFQNYYSNGYNTDSGNFAFLTSLPYLHGKPMLSENYYDNSIIKIFNKNGYRTNIFYSASNIGLLRDIWISSGFDNEYDGTLPTYQNSERLVFNSVPDLDMFKELLNNIDNWHSDKPFFTMVMTTTTHHPYILPITREKDYNKVVSYIDNAINYLYEELDKKKFFDDGILVITGDHRVMNPYTGKELEKYGEIGVSRVPLIIVGVNDQLENIDKNHPMSHTSLGGLLEYLCLPKSTYYAFNYQPYINDSNKEVNPIFYQVHEPEDKVLFLLDNKEYTLYLNGDETYVESNELSEKQKENMLQIVTWLRK